MEERYSVRSVLNDPAAEVDPAAKRAEAKTPLEKAKNHAMNYLRRPHSEAELRKKLAEKGCTPEDTETVVALCLDYGFLDDREYAAMLVRHYGAGGYGEGRVRSELKRHGIDPALWAEALSGLTGGEDTLDRLLAARLRGTDVSDRREREKAAAALFRRGFSWEDIRAAMNRYREE